MVRAHRIALALIVASSVLHPAASGARASARCGAPADFDRDGYTDVAIGAPGEDIGQRTDAGGVNVLYGGPDGITARENQFFSQASAGIKGAPGNGDGFGTALASGDFDGDGYADLAVGVPGEDRSAADAGAVAVLYGTRGGISARDRLFTLDTRGIKGRSLPGARMGSALVAGDFDGDGRHDLAVGIPNHDVQIGRSEFRSAAGAVLVLYGSQKGLSTRDQLWSQHSRGIKGVPEHHDHFGATLGTGDFNADGRCDLVVGVPDEDIGSAGNAGAIHVIYGSGRGLTARGDRVFSQSASGVPGTTQSFDAFGSSFSTGDFDADGYPDLAVGVPGDRVGNADGAGAVHVFFGSRGGLTASRTQLWSQDSPGIRDAAETGDAFGTALAAGDFDRDGFADLAIGAPHESRAVEPQPPEDPIDDPGGALEEILSAPAGETMQSYGVVHVLHGSSRGLSDRDQLWSQDSAGIADRSDAGDLFGFTLSAGRFDPGAALDLAVGVPNEGIGGVTAAGATHVLYGSGDGLTSSRSQLWSQNSPGVRETAERDDRLSFSMLG